MNKEAVFNDINTALAELQELVSVQKDAKATVLIDRICNGIDSLAMEKCGPGKILVVIREDSTILIHGTSTVSVILARFDRDDSLPVLESETLLPLPEQAFHELVCDELASAVQDGSVDPATINNLLK